jgi:hypothetical protein
MNTLEINNEQYDDNYPIELLIRRYTTYREQYIELKLINEICGISIRNQYKTFDCPHTKLSINYYIDAMNLFNKKNTKFLIFSDDIEESKTILSSISDIYDIEYTSSLASAHGMCSMSMCDHIINANSGFSFWASLLNHNKNKKIIYPNYFIDPKINKVLATKINHKWCPSEWIGLEST